MYLVCQPHLVLPCLYNTFIINVIKDYYLSLRPHLRELFFPAPGKMYNVFIFLVTTKTSVNVLHCFILCVIALFIYFHLIEENTTRDD